MPSCGCGERLLSSFPLYSSTQHAKVQDRAEGVLSESLSFSTQSSHLRCSIYFDSPSDEDAWEEGFNSKHAPAEKRKGKKRKENKRKGQGSTM